METKTQPNPGNPKPLQHISFQELCNFANQFFAQNPEYSQFHRDAPRAVIVFKQESFTQEYSLESRSYIFTLANKYFLPNMGGNSLFANCLDGSEQMVRLDWYLGSWKIDYCYLLEY